jgi:hypothetical protein
MMPNDSPSAPVTLTRLAVIASFRRISSFLAAIPRSSSYNHFLSAIS